MRLIPALSRLTPPVSPKLFIGMSDITALNLYFQQQWQWPVIHGALSKDRFSPESALALKSILFGEKKRIEISGIPLNIGAEKKEVIESTMTGGNLCLVQASLGTLWQINANNKLLFLEEVGERGYRIDRMLTHLRQANVFNKVKAIVFGDFLLGKEPDGSSLVQPVLERFAKEIPIPVVQIKGVGHGYVNFPLLLGTSSTLHLGTDIKLTC
jgi:muramoyltetrapeptide carboxypeptidase